SASFGSTLQASLAGAARPTAGKLFAERLHPLLGVRLRDHVEKRLRLQFDRLAEIGHCEVALALLLVEAAPKVIGLDIPRFEGNGAIEGFERMNGVVLLYKNEAACREPCREFRIERKRPIDIGGCFGEVALLDQRASAGIIHERFCGAFGESLV